MSLENHGGMIWTGNTPDSFTRALWQSCQLSHLVANQEELGEGSDDFSLQSIFIHTSKGFLHAVKSYDMGPTALLPLRRNVCCGFLLSSAGFELSNLWSVAITLTITPPRQRVSRLVGMCGMYWDVQIFIIHKHMTYFAVAFWHSVTLSVLNHDILEYVSSLRI
jgi:hypothetical protein